MLSGSDAAPTINNNIPMPAKISVIIVTYNAAETLQSCLDSIYSQKCTNIEIVIIDGKSTDDTVQILQQNSDHIFYWKSEKDDGIYDAMNKALQHITGQWVYFMGADDELYPAFSDFARELKDTDTIYYARALCNGQPTIPVNTYSFVKYGICHQAMIYPKAVFDKNIFDIKYKISSDYALNISLYNSYKFDFKDYLVAKFNDTGVSSTMVDELFETDRPGMVLKYFGLKIWLRFMFWRFKRNLKKK